MSERSFSIYLEKEKRKKAFLFFPPFFLFFHFDFANKTEAQIFYFMITIVVKQLHS